MLFSMPKKSNQFNRNYKYYNKTFYFAGNLRRFRRICEHTQSVVSVVRRQPLPPASPRAARRNSTNKADGQQPQQPPSRSTAAATMAAVDRHTAASSAAASGTKNEVSDSSSCNSDVSHGIEANKNGIASNALTVPPLSVGGGTGGGVVSGPKFTTATASTLEATAAASVTSVTHHENKASPSSIATQKVCLFLLFQIIWIH